MMLVSKGLGMLATVLAQCTDKHVDSSLFLPSGGWIRRTTVLSESLLHCQTVPGSQDALL